MEIKAIESYKACNDALTVVQIHKPENTSDGDLTPDSATKRFETDSWAFGGSSETENIEEGCDAHESLESVDKIEFDNNHVFSSEAFSYFKCEPDWVSRSQGINDELQFSIFGNEDESTHLLSDSFLFNNL